MPEHLINGISMHVQRRGCGTPIIFIHGSLSDYRSWISHVRHFSPAYEAIAYSRRNHFPNPWQEYPDDYSILTEVEDLIGLMDYFRIDYAHLAGSSYGGLVALIAALEYSDRVLSLVLEEPPVIPLLLEDAEGIPIHEEFSREVVERVGAILAERRYEDGCRVFLDYVIGPGAYDRYPAIFRRSILDNASTLPRQLMLNSSRTPFACTHAGRIRQPVLLLSGEFSPAFLRHITGQLFRCLPNRRLEVVAGISHAIHNHAVADYHRLVDAFLAEVDG